MKNPFNTFMSHTKSTQSIFSYNYRVELISRAHTQSIYSLIAFQSQIYFFGLKIKLKSQSKYQLNYR